MGDSWLYSRNNWTAVLTSTSPAARGGGALAYTASSHEAVLFGGYSSVGNLINDGTWRLV